LALIIITHHSLLKFSIFVCFSGLLSSRGFYRYVLFILFACIRFIVVP
jgi:hypothetical protein